MSRGDHAAALAPLEEAVAACRELGDRANLAAALTTLGEASAATDDVACGEALLAEALAIAREIGHREYEAGALGTLSETALARDAVVEAAARVDEALELGIEIGNRLLVVWCLERAAVLAARTREPEAAIRILAAAEAPRRDIAVEADPEDQRLLAEALRGGEEALTAEEVAAEFGAGRAMTMDDAVAEAQRVLRRTRALGPP
jgi:tetratricopeptide (TPR) repeat protein